MTRAVLLGLGGIMAVLAGLSFIVNTSLPEADFALAFIALIVGLCLVQLARGMRRCP